MQHRSEETRQKLLTIAEEMFAKNGYEATGVAEICHAADVSKGAFYHHFPSKNAVFLELLKRWLGILDFEMHEIIENSQNVPQALIDMSSMVGQIFKAGAGKLPMFLEFWLQSSRNPQIWSETIAPYHHYQQMFADVIRTGIKEGSLEEVDPDLAARVIVSIAVGIILQGLLDPQGARWDQVAPQSIQLFLKGVVRRSI